ncbi:MAG: hypothetical protein AABZ74_11475 [Cyanobacteriota bacterium]
MTIPNNVSISSLIPQLKDINNLNNKNNIEKINFTEVSSLTKKDSISLSSLSTTNKPITNISFASATPHTSSINQKIMDGYMKYDNDNSYKPLIQKAENLIKSGTSMKDLEKNIINLTKESNPKLSNQEVLNKAYKSIVVSIIKNPSYSDSNFFNGQSDKLLHFFTSASMTTNISNSIPFIPNNAKTTIGGSIMKAVGFFKEVKDITGSGFSKEDISANNKGISSAKENISKLDKYGKL